MQKIVGKLAPTVAAVTASLVVGGGAGAFAATNLIHTNDIANNAVTSAKLAPGAVHLADLAAGAKAGLDGKDGAAGAQGPAGANGKDGKDGAPGAAGAQGATGAVGPQGPAGPAGQSLVANVETPKNSAYAGFRVVDVPTQSVAQNTPSVVDGVPLVSAHVDAGTYLVSTTVQFFHLDNTVAAGEYGAASLSLGTTDEGTIWTPQIPVDSKSGAQATGEVVVTVPSDDSTLTIYGAVNGGNNAVAAQAGATLIVTKLDGAN